ncbi:sugar ABC transporter substrate-binding protein [Leucobacter celer]|uniref:sugar ABC transporter substrate-binding protein n=1 Tax=Leucobacter celer TaxID=668625 RepID=UPI0006A7AF20|nr:sugar ABC transporter substrate-binding protein [Leucobacter celer]
MYKKTFGVLACAALLLGSAGCSANGGGGSAADNETQLAEIDQSLEGNLYIQAAAESGEGSNTCPVTVGADESVDIAFSIEGLSHPFLNAQVDAAKKAASEVNATVTVQSGDDDVNKQLSTLETALNQSPDGLLLMPATTEGLQPILKSYEEADVPYAFTGKGMTGVNPVVQFLAPYGEEGAKVGEFVVNEFGDSEEPVKVAVISGITGDVSSVARTGMFKRALLENGNFDIVAEQAGEYRRQPSQDAMDAILAANPDVQLVFGANDEAALGAIDAVKAAGLSDQVSVVGIDGQPEMYDAIENGDALATVDHLPSAGEATKLLVSCLRGEEVPAFKVMVGDLVDLQAIEGGKTPAW